MRAFTEIELHQLISTIGRVPHERQAFHEQLHGELIIQLENCIVWPKCLEQHVRLLLERADRDEKEEVLGKENARRVLHQGLSVLTPDELLRLAMSPTALMALARYIDEHPFECYYEGPWGEIFRRLVDQDMRRRGFDPEAVIAKAKAECPALQ